MIATLDNDAIRAAAASCGLSAADYLRLRYGRTRRRLWRPRRLPTPETAPESVTESAIQPAPPGAVPGLSAPPIPRTPVFGQSWREGLRWYLHRRALAALDDLDRAIDMRDIHCGRLTVRRILAETAARYGRASREIAGHRRARILVQPRFEVCWRARRETAMSLPQIGRALGGRDHTTVLHAVRQYEAWRAAAAANERRRFPFLDWEKLL